MSLSVFVTVVVAVFSCVKAANILCVFPTPAMSHHLVFNEYVDKLVVNGHNVTVITPLPRGVQHIIEIDCSLSAVQYFSQLINESTAFKKKGIVADESTVTAENYVSMVDMIVNQFQNTNVTDLITNKNNYYDVVVVEAYMEINLVFGYLYNAPIILFSSGYATNGNMRLMNRHVTYNYLAYPNVWRSSFHKDALEITHTEERLEKEWNMLEFVQNERLKQLFGANTPTIEQMQESVQMMFVNVPHIFDNNRPVSGNVHYLGGVHLKKPQDVHNRQLKSFLNRYSVVVYVSFGSIADLNTMADELTTTFVNVFNNITYGVLWKIDNKHTTRRLGHNVLTKQWFPQRDILNHPNVKVFVSQCGVQSVDEAIDSVVPLVCVPLAGDQFNHANKIQQFGVGVNLDILHLQEQQLHDSIVSIVNNNTYTDNMYRLKKHIHDTNVLYKPVNKAVMYTNTMLTQQQQNFFWL
ncbi:egt [Clostera anastomosis granulovirus B]|uniref:Ecdysteroid UDP-glucosyltransferase n=1 Tax=Clostera anastomosis granulovirus B TaxID=1986290 RepID=A0A0K0WSC2_9BBAC|nr:egt [Clostera anastomosis granulovirus B]AKS25465.1 egt [Clostera anastomosis granulovirus B]